jgi:hypothetical protein
MIPRIELFGRVVNPITTLEGRNNYYDDFEQYKRDGFTEFVHACPTYFIPVMKEGRWALYTPGGSPTLATDFRYSSIIVERHGTGLFFVQDAETGKWGVLHTKHDRTCKPESMYKLEELLPPLADDIYEDELMEACASHPFWMIRSGEKVGILTPFGCTNMIYDTYETDDEEFLFKLMGSDGERIVDYSMNIVKRRKCDRCILDEVFHINGVKVYMKEGESVCEFPNDDDYIPLDDGMNVCTLELILFQAGRGCKYCCVQGNKNKLREIELKYGGEKKQ